MSKKNGKQSAPKETLLVIEKIIKKHIQSEARKAYKEGVKDCRFKKDVEISKLKHEIDDLKQQNKTEFGSLAIRLLNREGRIIVSVVDYSGYAAPRELDFTETLIDFASEIRQRQMASQEAKR